MTPELSGILIGLGSASGAGLLVWIAASLIRLWRTPKRLDRIEAVVPPLLRAVLALLKCQKSGKCNGETDESITELNELITNGIISQRGSR